MKKKSYGPKDKRSFTLKSNVIPITQAMLYGVRDELMSRLSPHDSEFKQVNSQFNEVYSRFDEIDAKFEQVDARFEQIDARFDEVNARFDSLENKIVAEIRRIGVLVEEQRAKNVYVLDGITHLSDRVEKVEQRLTRLENE